jgi:chitodextrinase
MQRMLQQYFVVWGGMCIVLSSLALPAFAQTAADTFTVQTMVGADTTPPSIPLNVAAIPVATSQIDLSWDVSTDDWILSGYHLWRDDVLIATTTATTYADTGLAASTTYRYYVTAFDSVGNESASSTEVSTTTLAIPAPTTEDTRTTYGTRVSLQGQILSLQVIPGQYGAVVRYTTRDPIRSVLRYGEGISYELGSVRAQAFLRTHEVVITGLSALTQYAFSIEGELPRGRYGVIHTGLFTTLPPDDVFPPGNVMQLRALRSGDGVALTWNNPSDTDFDHVRVVRNDRFYPTDTADGWLVYEGAGEAGYDADAARTDGWRYYTVFTYDTRGNISSGAVVALLIGVAPFEEPTVATTTPIALVFPDIIFFQEGERVASTDGQVLIDGSKQFTISIPYERLPEHLKTIILEIHDSADPSRQARFLLRVDGAHTAYTATVAPLGIRGEFPIIVTVYDFATRELGAVEGMLQTELISSIADSSWTWADFLSRYAWVFLVVAGLAALVFLGRHLLRTRA